MSNAKKKTTPLYKGIVHYETEPPVRTDDGRMGLPLPGDPPEPYSSFEQRTGQRRRKKFFGGYDAK